MRKDIVMSAIRRTMKFVKDNKEFIVSCLVMAGIYILGCKHGYKIAMKKR